jgi:hypothetical protein
MIIATSGIGSSINYNRIISLTSSNFVVVADSKAFRDSLLDSNKILTGIFIIDKDNLLALIWDSYTLTTDLASLNLKAPSVIYKPSLLKINNMLKGVFVSASVYYIPSQSNVFYKDYSNYVSLDGT